MPKPRNRPGDRRKKRKVVSRIQHPDTFKEVDLFLRSSGTNEPGYIISDKREGKPDRREGPIDRRSGTDQRKGQIGTRVHPHSPIIKLTKAQYEKLGKASQEGREVPQMKNTKPLRVSSNPKNYDVYDRRESGERRKRRQRSTDE